MVNTSNFLRCTRITDFKNIFLWKSTITLRHTAFWFYNKVDLECVLPRFSWRAGLHRRRSVSAPIILVLPLSTSHSFASFYLSQYLHFSFSRVCILSFSISKLHSSHILFTFYPLPSVPSSLQRRHVFTLSSLLRATSLFPTENSAAAGEQFSLDPTLAQDSSAPNLYMSVVHWPVPPMPVTLTSPWLHLKCEFFWENCVDIKVFLSVTVTDRPFCCRLPNAELNLTPLPPSTYWTTPFYNFLFIVQLLKSCSSQSLKSSCSSLSQAEGASALRPVNI